MWLHVGDCSYDLLFILLYSQFVYKCSISCFQWFLVEMGDLLYFQKWQIKGPYLEGVSVTLTAQFLGVSNNISFYDYDKEWQSNQYLAYLLPNVSSSKATFKIVSCMQQIDSQKSKTVSLSVQNHSDLDWSCTAT